MSKQFDKHDNIILRSYFDKFGEPIISSKGYSVAHFIYDKYGRETSCWYGGVDGFAVCNENYGYFSQETEYIDTYGSYREYYYGNNIDGLTHEKWSGLTRDQKAKYLSLRSDANFAIYQRVLNMRGGMVEVSYFGANGAPAIQDVGYATVRYSYDKHDRFISEWFEDANGNAVCEKSTGAFCREYEYNEYADWKEYNYGINGSGLKYAQWLMLSRDEKAKYLSVD